MLDERCGGLTESARSGYRPRGASNRRFTAAAFL